MRKRLRVVVAGVGVGRVDEAEKVVIERRGGEGKQASELRVELACKLCKLAC
jgi:hypothetical protein